MGVWQLFAEDVYVWKTMGLLGAQYAGRFSRLREALLLLWRYPGVRATLIYRLSHAADQRGIPLVPMLLFRHNLKTYGLDIVPHVSFGPGLYIPHPVGTVVMTHTVGRNCHLVSGVTIGMRNEHEFPMIGDNVTIGAGARVLGGIVIGNNVRIGANAVVVSDVPDGATAVGIPARVVTHSHASNDKLAEQPAYANGA